MSEWMGRKLLERYARLPVAGVLETLEDNEETVVEEQKKTTEELLVERGRTHGEYADHARCTQTIMRAVQAEKNWDTLPDIIRETLHMWAHKIGRIATGNPYLHDHYADVNGYSTLVVQRTVDGVGLKPEYVRATPAPQYSWRTTERVGEVSRTTEYSAPPVENSNTAITLSNDDIGRLFVTRGHDVVMVKTRDKGDVSKLDRFVVDMCNKGGTTYSVDADGRLGRVDDSGGDLVVRLPDRIALKTSSEKAPPIALDNSSANRRFVTRGGDTVTCDGRTKSGNHLFVVYRNNGERYSVYPDGTFIGKHSPSWRDLVRML